MRNMNTETVDDTQPPGWYTSTTGVARWWDGQSWGPTAPGFVPKTPRRMKLGAQIAIIVAIAVPVSIVLWAIIPFDLG